MGRSNVWSRGEAHGLTPDGGLGRAGRWRSMATGDSRQEPGTRGRGDEDDRATTTPPTGTARARRTRRPGEANGATADGDRASARPRGREPQAQVAPRRLGFRARVALRPQTLSLSQRRSALCTCVAGCRCLAGQIGPSFAGPKPKAQNIQYVASG